MTKGPVRLDVAVGYATPRAGIPAATSFRKWVAAALAGRIREADLAIRVVDAKEGQSMNHHYRGKDYPTNVLSFPMLGRGDLAGLAGDGPPVMLGDLALAYGVCAREAAEKAVPIADHATHLIVHGTLHLVGYDHGDDASAGAMEALEVKALASLGLANPYAELD